jgi:hypothetical protein
MNGNRGLPAFVSCELMAAFATPFGEFDTDLFELSDELL